MGELLQVEELEPKMWNEEYLLLRDHFDSNNGHAAQNRFEWLNAFIPRNRANLDFRRRFPMGTQNHIQDRERLPTGLVLERGRLVPRIRVSSNGSLQPSSQFNADSVVLTSNRTNHAPLEFTTEPPKIKNDPPNDATEEGSELKTDSIERGLSNTPGKSDFTLTQDLILCPQI